MRTSWFGASAGVFILLTACWRNGPEPVSAMDIPSNLEGKTIDEIRAVAAGAWRTPVSLEIPLNIAHLYDRMGRSPKMALVRMTNPALMKGEVQQEVLDAALAEYNEAQEDEPWLAHYRFERHTVDGHTVLYASEVLGPDERWIPARNPMAQVVELDLDGSCSEVANAVWIGTLQASPELKMVSIIDTFVQRPRSMPLEAIGSCAIGGLQSGREHLVSLLAQLGQNTGEPWMYSVKQTKMVPPEAPCSLASDGTNATGRCNEFTLYIRPLSLEEQLFDGLSKTAMRLDAEVVAPGFRVPRDVQRTAPAREQFLPDVGPPVVRPPPFP